MRGRRNAYVQVILVSRYHHRQYRDHAHDPQRPVALDRQVASCAAVLLPGNVDPTQFPTSAQPLQEFAIEPDDF
jgi:hypothetical protein